MATIDDEVRNSAVTFSQELYKTVTLEKMALMVRKQYEAARATEIIFHWLVALKALQLKKQGFNIPKIAKTLFPSEYSLFRENTTKFVRDILKDFKQAKVPKLNWPIDPRDIENFLKTLAGSDAEKWTAIKETIQAFLESVESWPDNPEATEITKAQAEHFVHIFLREPPGRPLDRESQRIYSEAARLKYEGLTNAQITKKLFPDQYDDPMSRRSATERVRKGIDRYLKAKHRNSSTEATRPIA